jgi:hypothetical protein
MPILIAASYSASHKRSPPASPEVIDLAVKNRPAGPPNPAGERAGGQIVGCRGMRSYAEDVEN